MPISHVFAEGIGPFKKVHLDLRGPDGQPSLGPHILAGVNGSGKSTILKAIAWCLAKEDDGFSELNPRVLLIFGFSGSSRFAVVRAKHLDGGSAWARQAMIQLGLNPSDFPIREEPGNAFSAASYSSHGFATPAENDAIEVWLLSLYIKRVVAKERGEPISRYTAVFNALERGLKRICGDEVSIVLDIEPSFQPRLQVGERIFDLSQIPDGLKATLGWMADFLMRDAAPGLLLFDGIEGFLHPLWQRRVLPALREALPETQSIVTSHSPFVISSCAEAIIHVLKVNKDGGAYVEPPVQAPIGESITSTLKDIFGVDSRFDVDTEKLLNEWNELNKNRADEKLKPADDARFKELTRVLSSRSEELRSIVNQPAPLPKAVIDQLTEPPRGGRVRRRTATH
ncbi:MAG TPA: AAA family ATPase [Bryobacteraceae bacterium]|jgi:hypothetical protein